MKLVKFMVAAGCMATVVGCTNTQENYYAAMERAAVANAEMHRAKMEALSAMASNGDAAAQGAAVMAMALTTAPVVTPQYVESESLSWARVLATPVATVAGLGIQASVAKNASDNAAMVQMATMQSQENIQLGQQNMLVDALGVSGAGTSAAVDGLVTLGTAGFDALNNAGDQTVGVATVGFQTTGDVAAAGFQTTGDVAAAGFQTTGDVAAAGFQTTGDVATLGFNATEAVSLGAQTSLVTLGNSGYDAVTDITSQYNTLMEQYNATMQAIATDNPDVCVADPVTGTVTCN